jgi:hypothetical protein
MQMRGSILNVEVLILASPAFHRKYATPVDIFEIPIRKLVVSFGIFGFLAVNTQIPFPVFGETMKAKELIFLPRGRLVLTPCIPFVEHKSSLVYERFGVVICISVERDSHGSSFLICCRCEIAAGNLRVLLGKAARQEAQRHDGNQSFEFLCCNLARPACLARKCARIDTIVPVTPLSPALFALQ